MLSFDPVTPSLLVGTCPKDEADITTLKNHSVSRVLCLQTDHDMISNGIHWPSLETAYAQQQIVISRLAMVDFDEDNIAALLGDAADAVEHASADDAIVYLHCTAGRERSPTVAAAWLIKYHQMTADQACRVVNLARPSNPYVFMLRALQYRR